MLLWSKFFLRKYFERDCHFSFDYFTFTQFTYNFDSAGGVEKLMMDKSGLGSGVGVGEGVKGDTVSPGTTITLQRAPF